MFGENVKFFEFSYFSRVLIIPILFVTQLFAILPFLPLRLLQSFQFYKRKSKKHDYLLNIYKKNTFCSPKRNGKSADCAASDGLGRFF